MQGWRSPSSPRAAGSGAAPERIPYEYMGSARLVRKATFNFGLQPTLYVKVYEVDGTVEELAESARAELNTRNGWSRSKYKDGPNTPFYEVSARRSLGYHPLH